jgi:S-adenosyl methyltransferase
VPSAPTVTSLVNNGSSRPSRNFPSNTLTDKIRWHLGGKDNFTADREVGDGLIAAIPPAPVQARQNRALLGRAVGYPAGQAGTRQFLDIGTGIPAIGNTHEVAQAAAAWRPDGGAPTDPHGPRRPRWPLLVAGGLTALLTGSGSGSLPAHP